MSVVFTSRKQLLHTRESIPCAPLPYTRETTPIIAYMRIYHDAIRLHGVIRSERILLGDDHTMRCTSVHFSAIPASYDVVKTAIVAAMHHKLDFELDDQPSAVQVFCRHSHDMDEWIRRLSEEFSGFTATYSQVPQTADYTATKIRLMPRAQ